MKLRHIVIGLLFLLPCAVRGQERSVGPVPEDLKMSVEELYLAERQRAERLGRLHEMDNRKMLSVAFHINKMMASGRILYGDATTRMVEQIADVLLKDYPALRPELRFYTVDSPVPNAFATGQGMVFVTLGLVAQVETEAQLAFILGHEIVHYCRSHAMEELAKAGKRMREGEYDGGAGVTDFVAYHSRSREMEREADSLGIEMFYRNSPYSKGVTEGVFDVMQYGALPFDDVEFDTTWFNTSSFRLEGCWLAKGGGIESRDNYDDSRSSHPNILSRRRRCAALLQGGGGADFVSVGQGDFEALRHAARMECVRQEVVYGQYAAALYNAWLLRRTAVAAADIEALDRYMAYALYGYALDKAHDMPQGRLDYECVEGESRQVYYALQTMSVEQVLLVALNNVWQAHRRYPAQDDYALMAADLMEELRLTAGRSIDDYMAALPAADSLAPTDVDDTSLSKYERIRLKRREQTMHTATSYALTDLLMADSLFGECLKAHLGGTADTARPADTVGRGGLMVFNPAYLVYNNVSDEVKVAKGVANEARLTERLMHHATLVGKRGIDFSDGGLRDMESDSLYNDFMTLCEWMNEFWLDKGRFRRRLLMQSAMDEMTARHDAREVNLTAVVNVENCRGMASPRSLFAVPFLPIELIGIFSGIERTSLSTLTIDARQGKVVAGNNYKYGVADHNALLDAMLYDSYQTTLTPGDRKPAGFLGRRLAVEAGASLGMAGLYPMGCHHFLALTPWATAEYAVSRRWTLTLSARYHGGYDDVEEKRQRQLPGGYGWVHDTVTHSADMLFVSLGVRRFERSDFAPLGIYTGFGATWVRMKSLQDGEVGNTFGLYAGVGRNYVFFDRLVLNYEVQYSYIYGLLHNLIGDEETRGGYEHHSDAAFSNMLTFRLGLGFLPL